MLEYVNFPHKGDLSPKPGRHWELAGTDPSNFYDVQLVEDYSEHIGSLIVGTYKADSRKHSMTRGLTLDHYDSIKVLDILPKQHRR